MFIKKVGKSQKKEGEKRATHIFALLKNMSATPTSLPILGVALRSGAQKSAALVHIAFIQHSIQSHLLWINVLFLDKRAFFG